jgi:photosystem I subunit 12
LPIGFARGKPNDWDLSLGSFKVGFSIGFSKCSAMIDHATDLVIMTIGVYLAMLLATALSNTQVYVALAVALIPAVLAFRLSTELYK